MAHSLYFQRSDYVATDYFVFWTWNEVPKGRKIIYIFISFERFGLVEQHWSLMLSLTFQLWQLPWNILGGEDDCKAWRETT